MLLPNLLAMEVSFLKRKWQRLELISNVIRLKMDLLVINFKIPEIFTKFMNFFWGIFSVASLILIFKKHNRVVHGFHSPFAKFCLPFLHCEYSKRDNRLFKATMYWNVLNSNLMFGHEVERFPVHTTGVGS